ncbi:DsbA family oxidoreductase [Brevibacillus antibioticus]|uniref:DsbA family oxidoreductase n=1 Tax=Brevibacillus antibioticus TaxID=2570228 RepID=A0A4U2Y966_9BACL|nr:DsbA family oxidoreductase [Brevibacillus antibioticus]TKI57217.1 DsbA family oxidoreductase [Brevibacillus antibioticus]
MKIEIWSDFACPFCYIGKRRLEGALSQFPHKDQVEVVYRSFQLDPQMERDTDMDMHEVLAAKYSIPLEQAKGMNDQVTQMAKGVGLDYHFDTMIPTNTFDAHRLTHFAHAHGKMKELKERLLKAYFTESLHLGDHEVLAQLASEVGLDKEATLTMLAGNEYREQVQEDKQRGNDLGVTGVPFFVINNKYAVSGAQPGEVFLGALNQVWEEESAAPALKFVQNDEKKDEQSGDNCTDGSCKI